MDRLSGRAPWIVAIVCAALMLGPTAAVGSPPAAVGVEIGPSWIERDLDSRDFSARFQIANHETSPRRVTMSVAGLGHDLDGTPEFLEPAPATSAIALDATSFVLAGGARRTVTASGRIPDGDAAIYASIIAAFEPLQTAGGAVESRSRVASLLLLRGPRPWRQTVSIDGVGFLPGTDDALTLFAAVRNTGTVHVRPSGTARILKDGNLLATVALKPELIIPGFARRLIAAWKPPVGLAGPVTLEVVTSPYARHSATFDLGADAAQRPRVEIINLRAHDDGGAAVTMTIVNRGEISVTPAVTVYAKQDGAERARTVLLPGALAPGASKTIEWRPELDDGVYLVTAEARSGDLLLDASSTGLRIGAAPAAPAARTTRTIPIAIAVALLILTATALVRSSKRPSPSPVIEREELRRAA